MTTVRDVLGYRIRGQQLDRSAGALADTAILDLGVQDTGSDGGRWALAIRGVDPTTLAGDELILLWALRGAPHFYRRSDLAGVTVALQPYSEADAAKRIFDASKPLRAAGISSLDALDTVAEQMRAIVTKPMPKGDVSGALAKVLPEPYLRFCRPCNATHPYEQVFRLSAVRAGLEIQADTSPPVLEPIVDFPAPVGMPELDPIRAYLHLLGPATPRHVAAFLDAPQKEVKTHWPDDVAEVQVDGEARWMLASDVPALSAAPSTVVRLLGPYDLFLQAKDRESMVSDKARAKSLWPVLGRPGAVLAGGELAGTWRARKSGQKLTVTVTAWGRLPMATRAAIREQSERLAAFRGLTLDTVEFAA